MSEPIRMNAVYYNLVGEIDSYGEGIVYRYIFGSADPNFYFSAFVVPNGEKYRIFYEPKTNNIDNSGAVKLDGESKDIGFNEDCTILIKNTSIKGLPELINISINIPMPPIALPGKTFDNKEMYKEFREIIQPLVDAELYELIDLMSIEEAVSGSVLKDKVRLIPMQTAYSYAFNILINKSIFKKFIPEELSDELITKEKAYELYLKMLYGNAYTNNIAQVFADIVQFLRIVIENNIKINDIDIEMLTILVSNWARTHSDEYIDKLVQVSNKNRISYEIDINTSTMFDKSKVLDVIRKIQDFVFFDKIDVYIGSDKVYSISFKPIYYAKLMKNTILCEEKKGVYLSDRVKFILTYGYGLDCDSFIGVVLRDDLNMKYYGLEKTPKVIDGQYQDAVIYHNGTDTQILKMSELSTSLGIKFVLQGI